MMHTFMHTFMHALNVGIGLLLTIQAMDCYGVKPDSLGKMLAQFVLVMAICFLAGLNLYLGLKP